MAIKIIKAIATRAPITPPTIGPTIGSLLMALSLGAVESGEEGADEGGEGVGMEAGGLSGAIGGGTIQMPLTVSQTNPRPHERDHWQKLVGPQVKSQRRLDRAPH